MHGKRGGQVMARHALYKLREISPLGARASAIARDRYKGQEAFERDCATRGAAASAVSATVVSRAMNTTPVGAAARKGREVHTASLLRMPID